MARKLSKSAPAPAGFEILPFVTKDGETVYLWACEHSCYDAPHRAETRIEAERLAQRHTSNKGLHPEPGEPLIRRG